MAILTVLLAAGARHVVVADKDGVVHPARDGSGPGAAVDRRRTRTRPASPAPCARRCSDAEVFIGVSAPNILTGADIATMAEGSIVFALANPVPEVDPLAASEHAAVVASGRSDFPNQINNVLAFPGVFRGLIDAHSRTVTVETLIAAARALAAVVGDDELNASYIVPSVFNPDVAGAVAAAVRAAVREHRPGTLGEAGRPRGLAAVRRGGHRPTWCSFTGRARRGPAASPISTRSRTPPRSRSSWRRVSGPGSLARPLAAVLAAHAIASEVIQHALLPSRSGDPADVLADLGGGRRCRFWPSAQHHGAMSARGRDDGVRDDRAAARREPAAG